VRGKRLLPLRGRILLSVWLVLEEALANVSDFPSQTQEYLGSLSWPCEKAEMKLRKQANTLKVLVVANSKIELEL
jgi:hypothetical protein